MRRLAFLLPLLAFAILAAPGCRKGDPAAGAADTAADDIREGLFDRPVLEQAAYLYGFRMGDLLRQQLPDSSLANELDYDILMAGFRAAFRGDSLPYDDATLLRVTRTIDDSLLLRQLRREAATDSAAAGFLRRIARGRATADSFMTANGRAEGVQTDESGVQYTVLQPGEGASPNRGDVVMLELKGQLLDGTILTETPAGQTVPVVVGAFAVEGLNSVLLDMTPGERRRMWIPPALAFGLGGIPSQGQAQPGIPPASVVVFDVLLAQVMGPEGAMTPGAMPPGAAPPGATAPPTAPAPAR
jgi:FKBP-type peptidyl-prolyl cis-trans isomerase